MFKIEGFYVAAKVSKTEGISKIEGGLIQDHDFPRSEIYNFEIIFRSFAKVLGYFHATLRPDASSILAIFRNVLSTSGNKIW